MFILHELCFFLGGKSVGLVRLVEDMGLSHLGNCQGIRVSVEPDLNFLLKDVKKPQRQKCWG